MFEVRELRLIKVIAEHGSLVRAARVLGVAQPALTRGLAAIEARLQGPLFERHARGVITTDLGRAILAEADDLLDRLDRLGRHVAAARGMQERDITVIAGAFVAEAIAMPAAARMLSQYPMVRLRLTSANWADVPRAVIEREAPIGLLDLRGFTGAAELEAEALRPQPGILAVRANHPLTLLPQASLADAMAYPMVMVGRIPRDVQAPIAEAREAAQRAGAVHPAFPALIHESPTASLAALRHSDAVLGVTIAIAAPALASGDVVALPWRAPWLSVHPGIVRLRDRAVGEAEQAFLDLLQTVDVEAEREALAWCSRLGVSPDCG